MWPWVLRQVPRRSEGENQECGGYEVARGGVMLSRGSEQATDDPKLLEETLQIQVTGTFSLSSSFRFKSHTARC